MMKTSKLTPKKFKNQIVVFEVSVNCYNLTLTFLCIQIEFIDVEFVAILEIEVAC